jgi:hypothetical protein
VSKAILGLSTDDLNKVETLAQELSAYGLGIFKPHIHRLDGTIEPLPLDMQSIEEDLRVKFVDEQDVPSDAIAVGWRWANGSLVVCARCCSGQPPSTNSADGVPMATLPRRRG